MQIAFSYKKIFFLLRSLTRQFDLNIYREYAENILRTKHHVTTNDVIYETVRIKSRDLLISNCRFNYMATRMHDNNHIAHRTRSIRFECSTLGF